MVTNFCIGASGAPHPSWTPISYSGPEGSATLRIQARKNTNNPGEPTGIILSASSSFYLDSSPQQVFNFLTNQRLRQQVGDCVFPAIFVVRFFDVLGKGVAMGCYPACPVPLGVGLRWKGLFDFNSSPQQVFCFCTNERLRQQVRFLLWQTIRRRLSPELVLFEWLLYLTSMAIALISFLTNQHPQAAGGSALCLLSGFSNLSICTPI
jgi:hypothetical protein